MKSKDGGTTARERKNNLLHRRYSQLGGRTPDKFVVGCDPALKYTRQFQAATVPPGAAGA